MPGQLRLVFAVAVGVTVIAAGCGGARAKSAISVQIKVTSTFFGESQVYSKPHTRSYTLSCRPTGGTLPFAARVCADIVRHPQPMLDPLPARTSCLGSPNMAEVTVTARYAGKTATSTDSPDCEWPGGLGAAIYFDAVLRNRRYLALTEPRLRCEEDRALLVEPTPFVSVEACRHGLWTPRTAHMIRVAEHLPQIASLGHGLFPTEIGANDCTIPAGGPAPGPRLKGRCEVTVKKVWSTPTVTFVESWPRGAAKQYRAILRVVFTGGKPGPIRHLGVALPQLWS